MRYLRHSLSHQWLLISVFALAIFAVACGTSAVQEQPAAQQDVVPKEAAKEVPKDSAVVVPTPIPIQEPAMPAVNAGKLTVMVPDFSTERFDRIWTAGEGANAYMIYMHSALVESDENRKMVPGIASEWSLSPDGASYSFKIREGVKFHDGTELTPVDVDAMNVISQWLYANRDRQDVVRLDELNAPAKSDAMRRVQAALRSSELSAEYDDVPIHAL